MSANVFQVRRNIIIIVNFAFVRTRYTFISRGSHLTADL